MESDTQHAAAVQQPVKMAHEPNNRAMWHTNCPDRRWPSPMLPLQETKQSCDATMRLWECAVCKALAWHGYRSGRPVVEQTSQPAQAARSHM